MTTKSANHVTTQQSAAKVLGGRLKQLGRLLRIASKEHLSANSLHDVRIACRQAEAALRFCRESKDSRAARWLSRHLRAFRRSTNSVRDHDVLRQLLKQHPSDFSERWRRDLKDHRQPMCSRIAARAKRLMAKRRFDTHVAAALNRLRSAEDSGHVSVDFGVRLFDELRRFVRAMPRSHDDVASLHRLRIAAKRLRYACGIVSDVWPEADISSLRDCMQMLQKQVGAIHDLQTAEESLLALPSRRHSRESRQLLKMFGQSRLELQHRFWKWWESCPWERTIANATAEIICLMRADV